MSSQPIDPETEKSPPKDTYCFTIAPPDKLQHRNSPCRIVQVSDNIRSILHDILGDRFPYWLIIEVTDPDTGQEGSLARVHFHGWIKLKPTDYITFYVEYFHKLNFYFRIEVKDMKNMGWINTYCSKQRDAMKPYCRLYNIPYEITEKSKLPSQYDSYRIGPKAQVSDLDALQKKKHIASFFPKSS